MTKSVVQESWLIDCLNRKARLTSIQYNYSQNTPTTLLT